MNYKLAKLTQAQIDSLSPKLKEEVLFVKDNTENFDELYFEVFQENDERLYKLAETELKTDTDSKGRKILDKNESAETIKEDKNGVRTRITKEGIGITEKVQIVPGKGVALGVRSDEFKTVSEKEKEQSVKNPAKVPEVKVVVHKKPYKKVTFKGETEPIYHVVKTIGDDYVVVIDEKLDLYHEVLGTDKVRFHEEQIPKSDFQNYKEPTAKVEKKPAVKKEEPKKEKVVANTTLPAQEKKKEAPKSSPSPADYSWRRKVPAAQLKEVAQVKINCDFYTLTADENMTVEIKQTFSKGDKILVNTDGYPFAVMTPDSFKKRCTKVIVEKGIPKPKQEEPAPKETPKANIPTEEPAPKKPEKGKCNLEAITANPPVPLLTWLNGQIELWKNRETNMKITKVMVVKDSGEVVIEFTHYDKLLRIADLRLSYHKICLESTKLTKVAEPKRGSYRLLVSKDQLRQDYSTKRNWNSCRTWIREAYQCARAGNCTEKQRELFKKFYQECGDLTAKSEDVAYLRWLHQQAGEGWKRGEETYLEAFGRVILKLKSTSKS